MHSTLKLIEVPELRTLHVQVDSHISLQAKRSVHLVKADLSAERQDVFRKFVVPWCVSLHRCDSHRLGARMLVWPDPGKQTHRLCCFSMSLFFQSTGNLDPRCKGCVAGRQNRKERGGPASWEHLCTAWLQQGSLPLLFSLNIEMNSLLWFM